MKMTTLARRALLCSTVFATALAAAPAMADDHGSTRLEVTESALVNAGASEVWAVVGAFEGLHAWHPVVSASEMANGEPTLRGAVRVLTVGDNAGTITETLTNYDDEGMALSYVINSTDVLPVQDYAATMRVLSVGDDTSLFIWHGSFKPKDAPGEKAHEVITGAYKAGMDALRETFPQ